MLSDEVAEAAAHPSAPPTLRWATAARYDRRSRRILVLLSNGLELSVPIGLAHGLASKSAAELGDIEISPAGLVLHWPKLHADLYLPALLNGVFGPLRDRWSAYWSEWPDRPRSSRRESPRSARDRYRSD